MTQGGISTQQEMCQAVITYYPKTDLSDCRSQPEFYSFFNAMGMRNVSGNALGPLDMPNQKFGQYNTP